MRGLCILLVVLALSMVSRGAVTLQFIDRGEPTDGVETLHGWRGIVIRAVSDGGPITGVDAGFAPTTGGIIGASLLQRWVDPTGNGFYTLPHATRSPIGLADNTTSSVENFDSHLLADPAHIEMTSPFGESNRDERFFLRTNLTSDRFVGYGASGPEPIFDFLTSPYRGRIWGSYDILPPYHRQSVDLAYVVTDSYVNFGFTVKVGDSGFGLGGIYFVPEPNGLIATAITSVILRRRRTNVEPVRRRMQLQPHVQRLEHRRLMSLDTELRRPPDRRPKLRCYQQPQPGLH